MNQIYHFVSSTFVVKIKNIMKICIIGNGLTSLTLAKTLVNQGIYVDIYYKNNEYTQNKIRTIEFQNQIRIF